MALKKASVGRIVHFSVERTREKLNDKGKPTGELEAYLVPLPALVVEVRDDDELELSVFGPNGGVFPAIAREASADAPELRHWHWPPTV